MPRSFVAVFWAILVALYLHGSPAAATGPLTGTENFKPQLPFNAACTIKAPPPFPDLTVQAYDRKIFVYTRYCAVGLPTGQVRVEILEQFTDGFHSGSITACATQVWLTAHGTEVLKSAMRTEVGAGDDKTLVETRVLGRGEFHAVSSWSWNFDKC
jgi:hypothetical protein